MVSFHGYLSFGCGLQAVPRVLGLVARLPLSVASGTLVPIFLMTRSDFARMAGIAPMHVYRASRKLPAKIGPWIMNLS